MKKVLVRKNAYYDSVFLMLAAKAVKRLPGIQEAAVVMGTDVNLELLKGIGFFSGETALPKPNDLVIAIEGDPPEAVEEACRIAEETLKKKRERAGEDQEYQPVSLDGALKILPEANLVVISVPGPYAAREARRALKKGLHVMLFSDHVSVEDEVDLKERASEKGLLMMGPDCGTAIINGKPICFANVVRRGGIGLVAASGSGLQEVTCCIDRMEGGISQALGTGGRDLQDPRVRGRMMLLGIEALKHDPETRVIVVLSKPPAEESAAAVLSRLEETGKPCVVQFLGRKPLERRGAVWFSGNLEETAAMAVALSRGETPSPPFRSLSEEELSRTAETEAANMSRSQRYVRGLFAGGTLALETMFLFEQEGFKIRSNMAKGPGQALQSPHRSEGHTLLDLGDDVFTLGRPHPMIDPSLREERIAQEAADSETALLILDVVLGYGAHEDPCGSLAESIGKAKALVAARGGYLSVVASITGTEKDFQNRTEQKKKLESAGCLVMPSNTQAALLAVHIMKKAAQRWM